MKTEMTSIERVDATIHFRKPDRVPVDLHNFQPAAYATGLPLAEVFKDGELLADAMLNAWRSCWRTGQRVTHRHAVVKLSIATMMRLLSKNRY
jgi:hypothetical protein